MVKVSIIVPVYNAEKYLEKCLESLCNQSLVEKEIICVNDCSTDSSLDILRRYESKGKITLIDMPQNGGVSLARNTGMASAQGEYVGFVDSDDWIDLDFYEKLYAKACKEKADIVKARLATVFEDGFILPTSINETLRKYNSKHLFCYEFSTAIYKTSMLKDEGIFFPLGVRIGEDLAFLSEAIRHAQCLSVTDDVCYYYFQDVSSALHSPFSLQKVEDLVQIRMKMVENVMNSTLDSKAYFDYLLHLHILTFHEISFRTPAGPIRHLCIKTLLQMYAKALDAQMLRTFVAQHYPVFARVLKSHDAQWLEKYFSIKIHKKDELLGNLLRKIKNIFSA